MIIQMRCECVMEIVDVPVTIVIPTRNAGSSFINCIEMIRAQTANIQDVLIVDTESTDGTAELCEACGFTVERIRKEDFGHGKTRQYALEKTNTEYVIYLTQDAQLYDENSILNLISMLEANPNVGVAYGRQIAFPHNGILGSYARQFNYPEISYINRFEDRKVRGIKVVFSSDSFCGYRKSLVQEIGGFPLHVQFAEDTYVAAKMLMYGYETAYCAEAKVYHAHDYTLKEEFMRYRQIGKFHAQEKWILDIFGKAEGEGIKLVIGEAKYLIKNKNFFLMLLMAIIHNVIKYIGYKSTLYDVIRDVMINDKDKTKNYE